METTQVQLNWTRFQLARALEREHTLLQGNEATAQYEAHHDEIRGWILLEVDPFCEELSDDELLLGGDTEGEPSELTVRSALHTALLDMTEDLFPSVDGPSYGAMRVSAPDSSDPTPTTYMTQAHSGRRPLLSKGEQECIVILLTICGQEALTLLDCGSTTQLLDNSFADVSGVKVV